MKHLIVSDSSPLIAMLNIEKFELLKHIFSSVTIPSMVAQEIEEGLRPDSSWFVLKAQGFVVVKPIKDDARLLLLRLQLDPGESEAILLADQLGLPLLIDEKAGRRMAKDMGLQVQGLVGVLYALKQAGYVSVHEMESIVSALDQVKFRMSNSLRSLLLN